MDRIFAILIRHASFGLAASVVLGMVPCAFAEEEGNWISSREFLNQEVPPTPTVSYPILQAIQGILLRSLQSADNAREIQNIYNTMGTPSQAVSRGVLLPANTPRPVDRNAEGRTAVAKTIGETAKKQTKITNFIPESWQMIKFGGHKAKPTSSPQPHYGLVLKEIEPADKSLKLASIDRDSDYEMLQYAGKAQLRYEVEPFFPENSSLPYIAAPIASPVSSVWDAVPAFDFSGSISPRGSPTAKNPIPNQVLRIEQTEAFYSMDTTLENFSKAVSVRHRVRLFQSMNYSQERDQSQRVTKNTLENIYTNGGLSCHLEEFRIENRYQAGMIYRSERNQFELYAHVPKVALEKDFWPQHRWELKLQRSF